MLVLMAVAFVIGLACHGLMVRMTGHGGFVRYVLVSMASSLVTAWCFYLANYLQLGEFPEPPAVAIIIAMSAFPASLASGLLFHKRVWARLTRLHESVDAAESDN